MPDDLATIEARRTEQEAGLSEQSFLANLRDNIGGFISGLGHLLSATLEGGKLLLSDPKDFVDLLTSRESGDLIGNVAKTQYAAYKDAISDPARYFHNHPFDAFLDAMTLIGAAGSGLKGLGRATGSASLESVGGSLAGIPDSLARLVFKEAPYKAITTIPITTTRAIRDAGGAITGVEKVNWFDHYLTKWGMNPFDQTRLAAQKELVDLSLRQGNLERDALLGVEDMKRVSPERRAMMDDYVRLKMTPAQVAEAQFTSKELSLIDETRTILNRRQQALIDAGKVDPDLALHTQYGEGIRFNPEIQTAINTSRAAAGAGPLSAENFKGFYLLPKEERHGMALTAQRWANEKGLQANYLPLYAETPLDALGRIGPNRGVIAPTNELRKRSGMTEYSRDLAATLQRMAHTQSRLQAMEEALPGILRNVGAEPFEAGMKIGPGKTLIPVGLVKELDRLSSNFLIASTERIRAVGKGTVSVDDWITGALNSAKQFAADAPSVLAKWDQIPAALKGGLYVAPLGAGMEIMRYLSPNVPAFLRVAGQATDFWKRAVLFLSIPWYLGNAVGNAFLYFLGGGGIGGLRRAVMPKFSEWAPDFIRATYMGSADALGRLSGSGYVSRVNDLMGRMVQAGQYFDGLFRKASFLTNVEREAVRRKFSGAFGSFRAAFASVHEVDDLVLSALRGAHMQTVAERASAAAWMKQIENKERAEELTNIVDRLGGRADKVTEHVLRLQKRVSLGDERVAQYSEKLAAALRDKGLIETAMAKSAGAGGPEAIKLYVAGMDTKIHRVIDLERQINQMSRERDVLISFLREQVAIEEKFKVAKLSVEAMTAPGGVVLEPFPGAAKEVVAAKREIGLKVEVSKEQLNVQMQRFEREIADRQAVLASLRKDMDTDLEHGLIMKTSEADNLRQMVKGYEAKVKDARKTLEDRGSLLAEETTAVESAKAQLQTLGLQNKALDKTVADAYAEASALMGPAAKKIVDKALDETEQFFFNYFRLSPPERVFFRLAFPFWTWYKNVSSLIWRLPYLSPQRTFLYQHWAQVSMELYDDVNKPDYLKDYVPIGVTASQDFVWASMRSLNPLNGAVMLNEANLVSRMHPLIVAGIEWISGRAVFNQKPLGHDVVRMWNGREYEVDPVNEVLRPRPQASIYQIPDTAKRLLTTFQPFRAMEELIRSNTRDENGDLPEDATSKVENGKLLIGADILSMLHALGISTIKQSQAEKLDNIEQQVRTQIIREIRGMVLSEARRNTPESQDRMHFLKKTAESLGSGDLPVIMRFN